MSNMLNALAIVGGATAVAALKVSSGKPMLADTRNSDIWKSIKMKDEKALDQAMAQNVPIPLESIQWASDRLSAIENETLGVSMSFRNRRIMGWAQRKQRMKKLRKKLKKFVKKQGADAAHAAHWAITRAADSPEQKLKTAADAFNESPKRGLLQIVKDGLLADDAVSIANFLRMCPGLNLEKIGEYIGEPDDFDRTQTEKIDTRPFDVRKAYMQTFNTAGGNLLSSMRHVLQAFQLPGEAQKIDRILEAFGAANALTDPHIDHEDAGYLLAISLMMLNTDAHNPTIPVQKKMKLEQFIRNNAGGNNGGDFDKQYLTDIYNSIREEEFVNKLMLPEFTPSADADFQRAIDGILFRPRVDADEDSATVTFLRSGKGFGFNFALTNEQNPKPNTLILGSARNNPLLWADLERQHGFTAEDQFEILSVDRQPLPGVVTFAAEDRKLQAMLEWLRGITEGKSQITVEFARVIDDDGSSVSNDESDDAAMESLATPTFAATPKRSGSFAFDAAMMSSSSAPSPKGASSVLSPSISQIETFGKSVVAN